MPKSCSPKFLFRPKASQRERSDKRSGLGIQLPGPVPAGAVEMTEHAVTLIQRYALPPDQIEETSLRLVRDAIPPHPDWSPGAQRVLERMAYAAGDISLASLVRFHANAVNAGLSALRRGATIVTDVRSVEVSLDRGRLASLGCTVHCAIAEPAVAAQAKAANLPRAVIAMRRLVAYLHEGIAVIGTAPTALLAVLDLIDSGEARPALIVGMPVGLVAATEAKTELMARDVPYITIEGTRGGSALAAAATNALLRLALEEPPQADTEA